LLNFRFLLVFVLACLAQTLWSQIDPIPEEETDTSEASLVVIDFADTTRSVRNAEGEEILYLIGNVELHQDSLFMYCDSTRKEKNNLHAKGNVILQQWDSTNVFADTLVYIGNEKDATLTGNVILENGPQRLYTQSLRYNLKRKIAQYFSRAWITNDTTTLTSIRGTYLVDTDEIYFRDSVYIQSTDFELYADTLKYQTETELVTFLGPTIIHLNDGAKVYCESGHYNLMEEKGVFIQNAQYVQDDREVTGDSILYDAAAEEVIVQGNGLLVEKDRTARGRTMIYDLANELLTIEGDGFVQDSNRVVESERLVYDIKNDQFQTQSRTKIDDDPQFMEADTVDFDNATGLGLASGNIVWSDTSSDYTIFTERALYSDSSSFLKAFQDRPVLLSLLDGDSLFMSSDTLISYEITDSIGSYRVFHAYHDVKIYKEGLQAICDSLTYSSRDSVFHLYQDPMMWSDTSQFSADTMSIHMANGEIDHINLKKDAFIINTPDEILYNQMQGKSIRVQFVEGDVRKMYINGNAESVYYALDDDGAYIGVNKTLCSNMLIHFGNNEVTDIIFYASPKATFFPIQKAKADELTLEGFSWEFEDRPKSEEEVRYVQ